MNARTSLFALAAAAYPLVIGCSGSADRTPKFGTASSALRRMQSCGELTQSLREDARVKMNARIDAEIRAIRMGYSYGAWFGPGRGLVVPGIAIDDAVGTSAPSGNAGATADPSTTAPAHSETETQVKGVDEADIVKADGTRLYVLHGQKFLIVNAWPAASLGVAGGLDIEGTPTEMFVAAGKAVVFSTVDGTELFTAAGVAPRAGYTDSYAPSVYSGVADVALPGGVPYRGGVPSPNPLTKVTVLALDGGSASVVRQLYFEGSY